MSQNGFLKKRRAVGSIIAGAFVLLIILSGYEFYILNNRIQSDYQNTLSTMRAFDIERSEEELKFTYIYLDPETNEFTVKIRNDGPEISVIKHIGIFMEGDINDDPYQPCNTLLVPTEVLDLEIPYDVDPDEEYLIQAVTEKGNIFSISYPQETVDYPYHYIVADAISEVIGRVLPTYNSFRWAIREQTQITDFEWIPTWSILYTNKDYHIFKIEILYYGKSSIVLSKNTGLYLINFLSSAQSAQYYIVYCDESSETISQYDETSNYVTLPAFNPDEPQPVTLYFASKNEGGDPTRLQDLAQLGEAKYLVTLGIYERPGAESGYYSQGFSLIAVEVKK